MAIDRFTVTDAFEGIFIVLNPFVGNASLIGLEGVDIEKFIASTYINVPYGHVSELHQSFLILGWCENLRFIINKERAGRNSNRLLALQVNDPGKLFMQHQTQFSANLGWRCSVFGSLDITSPLFIGIVVGIRTSKA